MLNDKSKQEIIYLYRNSLLTVEKIAKKFHITRSYVWHILKINNVILRQNKWKKHEIDFLIKNYPNFGWRYCSQQLGRNKQSIMMKVVKLKLRLIDKYKPQKRGNKICKKCNKEKSIQEFQKRPDLQKEGYKGICKDCDNLRQRTAWHTNPSRKQNKRKYIKKRLKNDIAFRISVNLRQRTTQLLTGKNKSLRSQILIGCDREYLKEYLEQQFLDGMTWENYGKIWHIDHIQPCYSFDLTRESEQRKCFHYTNLRPLWASTRIARQFNSEVIGNVNRPKKINQDSYIQKQTFISRPSLHPKSRI